MQWEKHYLKRFIDTKDKWISKAPRLQRLKVRPGVVGGTQAVSRNEGWPSVCAVTAFIKPGLSHRNKDETLRFLLKGIFGEKESIWTWPCLAPPVPGCLRADLTDVCVSAEDNTEEASFVHFKTRENEIQTSATYAQWLVLTSHRKWNFCQGKAKSFWLGPKGLFKLLKHESNMRFLTHSVNRSISPSLQSAWAKNIF